MNIAALLSQAAKRYADEPAVALGPAIVRRYGELARNVAGLAGGLRREFGLHSGDRVLVAMRNRPEYLEVLFGIWHAGLVAVPVNTRLHRDEVGYIAERAGARVCLADPELAEQLQGMPAASSGQLRLISVSHRQYVQLLQGEAAPVAAKTPHEPAWLFFTSGTTGRPKGAVLTHRNLMVMTLAHLADIDQIRPGDAMLHAAPLSHGCGLWAIPNTAMGGLNVVLEKPSYDPAEVLALLQVHQNVSMYHAPTMLTRLVNHPGVQEAHFTNLRTLIYGGSHMYRADLERALALIGPRLVQIYGQGEAPNTISMLSKASHRGVGARREARLGSAGYARTGVEIRVADVDDEALPAGELGEVLVRGDIVMAGYWQDKEATAAALRGGWLHTGDLGTLDEDGLLTLKDRSKDMIISGGSNIYPKELEEVLLRHPQVLEASVIGRPHREWGEEVCAFVVLRPGAVVDAAALDALCLAHLGRYKRPRLYRFVESLPKNAYNKILKSELRAQLAAEDAGAAAPQ
jgi:long-chain acyl-CoA synthetase